MISFTPFEVEFLATVNTTPSQVTPNIWGIVREFKIVCTKLEASHSIRVFLFFNGTKIDSKSYWVTLYGIPGEIILNSYSKPYTD